MFIKNIGVPSIKDELFQKKNSRVEDFSFGEKTAEVFDDMLDRSVPFYEEVRRILYEHAGVQ
jgi:tRNA (cmo5U34)-methyltransferase